MPPTLLGLSGGADSVYLLLRLLDQGETVVAVHVNHGLRGERSDGDELFVRALCAEKGVALRVYRAHPPENPGEGWAREARYAFFRQAAGETGADTIALAHHRDDQAETLLLHLLRGSGLRGLSGMAQESEWDGLRIRRPLLGMGREEIRAELLRRGQSWREDDSNADTRYLRNAIRQEIMPRLEALAPGAARRIASAADLMREDARALEGMADALLGEGKPRWIPLDRLIGQPEAIRSRVIRRWVEMHMAKRQEQSMTQQQTHLALTALDAPAGSKVNLPGSLRLYRGWTHLHILGGESARPEYRLMTEAFTGNLGDGKRAQVIPREIYEQTTLRTRRTGDFIRPFGSAGRQSLQDYLINRRVDAPFRDMAPLLCQGSEVLMVFGVGASEALRLDDTRENILLRLEGELPWAGENNGGNVK